jgi:Putative addiction module component
MNANSKGMTRDQIVDETRERPEEDVAEPNDRICRIKSGDTPPAVEAAWQEEVHRRIADLESGRVQGIPLEETMAKARGIVDP